MIDLNSTSEPEWSPPYIYHGLFAMESVIEEGNKIIKSITKCVERGEIEKGVKRGRCHIFLDHSNKCVCGDKDLSKYLVRKPE